MSAPTVYVIKNQSGQFLNKQQEWVAATDNHALYRTAHRDEAVNTVFEVSSKDIYLRAEAVACPVDAKGQPVPQHADLLSPRPETATDDAEAEACEEAQTLEADAESAAEDVPETTAEQTDDLGDSQNAATTEPSL